MTAVDHAALIDRLTSAINRHDWEALRTVYTESATSEYPQSGELFRGISNIIGQFASYPGGFVEGGVSAADVVGGGIYAATPMFTVILVEGSADRGTATFRVTYPDGSTWWVINMYELEGDRIARARLFFAPVFEAPDWRAPFRDPA